MSYKPVSWCYVVKKEVSKCSGNDINNKNKIYLRLATRIANGSFPMSDFRFELIFAFFSCALLWKLIPKFVTPN